MGRYGIIAGLIVFAIHVYVLVEASSTPQPRLMPRWSWVLLNLVLPAIGPVLWFIAGRPRKQPPRRGPQGPDDDPNFLGSL